MFSRHLSPILLFSKRFKLFLVGVIYLDVSLNIFKIDKDSCRSLVIFEIFEIFKDLQRQLSMGTYYHVRSYETNPFKLYFFNTPL